MQNAAPVKEDRRFWKLIVFGAITFGIYAIIYMHGLVKDLNTVCRRQEPDDSQQSPNFIVVMLLSIVTLSVYGLIWWNRQGNRVKKCAAAYGFEVPQTGKTYVLWNVPGFLLLFGGPAYARYLLLTNTNKLARAYNYQIQNGLDKTGTTRLQTGGRRRTGSSDPISGNGRGMAPNGGTGSNMGGYVSQPGQIPVYEDYEPTISRSSGTLEGIRGQYKDMKMNIAPGDQVVIGRGGQYSQLILSDMDISRKHCTVRFSASDASFYVTDHSSYGTFLNGSIRLEKEVSTKVPMGSRISLGNGNNEFLLK